MASASTCGAKRVTSLPTNQVDRVGPPERGSVQNIARRGAWPSLYLITSTCRSSARSSRLTKTHWCIFIAKLITPLSAVAHLPCIILKISNEHVKLNLTANVKQYRVWAVGMVSEQVPPFKALIRNFPGLLRRAQSSTTPPHSVYLS